VFDGVSYSIDSLLNSAQAANDNMARTSAAQRNGSIVVWIAALLTCPPEVPSPWCRVCQPLKEQTNAKEPFYRGADYSAAGQWLHNHMRAGLFVRQEGVSTPRQSGVIARWTTRKSARKWKRSHANAAGLTTGGSVCCWNVKAWKWTTRSFTGSTQMKSCPSDDDGDASVPEGPERRCPWR